MKTKNILIRDDYHGEVGLTNCEILEDAKTYLTVKNNVYPEGVIIWKHNILSMEE